MNQDIEVLQKIYRVVEIGIIGITEVLKKVDNKALAKVMIDEKKEYELIKVDVAKLLEKYDNTPKEIGIMMRLSNDLYTNMKLLKGDNDEIIAKMMLEGTNKAIIEITSIRNEKKYKNSKIKDIIDELLEHLEYHEQNLKKYL